VPDVGGGVVLSQRRQPRSNGDSLAELPEVRLLQLALELRLAGQDDLEELRVADFEVGEQGIFLSTSSARFWASSTMMSGGGR
jgi:hypothetical protein